MHFFVMSTSILLQFITLFIILRLAPATGWRNSWRLLTLAVYFITIFGCIALYHQLATGTMTQEVAVATTKWISFATSCLVLVGLLWLAPALASHEQTIEALRVSEERYRSLFEHSRDAIYVSTRDGKFIDVNSAMEDLFGYGRSEMIGIDVLEIYVDPADRLVFQREIESTGAVKDFELKFRKKDGTEMNCLLTATVYYAEDGKIEGYRGIIRDCTEFKQTMELLEAERQRLRRSEEKYRELVQNANSIILRIDTEGRITFINEFAELFFGHSEKEIVGRSMLGVIFQDTVESRQNIKNMIQGIIADQEQYVGIEMEHLRGDRESAWVVWTYKPILDRNGVVEGILCIGNDVTRHKRLEQQYRLAQRLESVGRLAGGVAHDFNNLLTIIFGYTEILLDSFAQLEAIRTPLQQIRNASERGASLVRQLLAFSRKQIMQPRIMNINETLTDTKNMLWHLIGEDIEIVTNLSPALMTVEVDPAQIQQVVMNLAVNARDAMPEGGRLTLETRNVDLDKAHTSHHSDIKPGSYVMLSMSDTGCGIDEETLAHIFDPFFTTKEEGKGTGLGLASVYGIVKQSSGFIRVKSEQGHGTTFRIYLPVARELVQTMPESAVHIEPSPKSLGGSETILLVEDEQGLRRIASEVLTKHGYTVLEASCGEEALTVHESYGKPASLLITDVIMPGMNGRELADRLQALHPSMRVVFMSGHTEKAIMHHGILDTGILFIQKPFLPTTLLTKIRGILSTTKVIR